MPAIKPMLADTAPIETLHQYTQNPDWTIEQKLDGDRIAMHIIDGQTIPIARHGQPYTKPIPQKLLQEYKPFKGQWVLDGELLGGQLHVFDVPYANETINTRTPWHLRRQLLEQLFPKWEPTETKLVENASTQTDKELLVASIHQMHGEGVMLKHRNGTYLPGKRSAKMLKAKFTNTLDCVILEKNRNGKRNIVVGLYNENKQLLDMGSVAMSDRNLQRTEPGMVVEIRYLYCGIGYRLYQPAFMRVRADKTVDECTTDQLVHVNKEIVAFQWRK